MCAIDYADEPFSVYRTNNAKARKVHKCDECEREICVGEKYLYAFGVFDGRGDSYHICAHCEVAAEWLMKNCGGFLHHGVSEDIGEHVHEYRHLAFGLLRFKVGISRKWKRFSGEGLLRLPPQAKPITVTEGLSPSGV